MVQGSKLVSSPHMMWTLHRNNELQAKKNNPTQSTTKSNAVLTSPVQIDVENQNKINALLESANSIMLKFAIIKADELDLHGEQREAFLVSMPKIATMQEFKKQCLSNKSCERFINSIPKKVILELPLPIRKRLLIEGSANNDGKSDSDNVKFAACYSSFFHVIALDFDVMNSEMVNFEGYLIHEVNHAIKSITRSMLSADVLTKILAEEIYDEMVTSKEFTYTRSLTSPLAEPPIITSKRLREKLANFTVGIINNLDEADKNIVIGIVKKYGLGFPIAKLSDIALEHLKKCLNEDTDARTEFQSFVQSLNSDPEFSNLFDNPEDAAILLFKSYIENKVNRCKLFLGKSSSGLPSHISLAMPQEEFKKLPVSVVKFSEQDNKKLYDFAAKSARECLSLMDGNAAIQRNICPAKRHIYSYLFTPEEISSDRERLLYELKKDGVSEEKTRQLNTTLRFYTLGEELTGLRKQLLQAPLDQNAVTTINRFRAIEAQYVETEMELEELFKLTEKKVKDPSKKKQNGELRKAFSYYKLIETFFSLAMPFYNPSNVPFLYMTAPDIKLHLLKTRRKILNLFYSKGLLDSKQHEYALKLLKKEEQLSSKIVEIKETIDFNRWIEPHKRLDISIESNRGLRGRYVALENKLEQMKNNLDQRVQSMVVLPEMLCEKLPKYSFDDGFQKSSFNQEEFLVDLKGLSELGKSEKTSRRSELYLKYEDHIAEMGSFLHEIISPRSFENAININHEMYSEAVDLNEFLFDKRVLNDYLTPFVVGDLEERRHAAHVLADVCVSYEPELCTLFMKCISSENEDIKIRESALSGITRQSRLNRNLRKSHLQFCLKYIIEREDNDFQILLGVISIVGEIGDSDTLEILKKSVKEEDEKMCNEETLEKQNLHSELFCKLVDACMKIKERTTKQQENII